MKIKKKNKYVAIYVNKKLFNLKVFKTSLKFLHHFFFVLCPVLN